MSKDELGQVLNALCAAEGYMNSDCGDVGCAYAEVTKAIPIVKRALSNLKMGRPQRKALSDEGVALARLMRSEGHTYKSIALQLRVSLSTIFTAVNGGSK